MLFGYSEKENIFKNLVERGALSHSYLFFGGLGVGKYSFAVSLANFLETSNFEIPKNVLIDSVSFLKNEKGVITIDSVRDLKKFLLQKPFVSKFRTVIIRGAEFLTEEAESALLKIVEEPPKHSLLIFISESEESLFAPLVSRLSKIYFPPFSRSEIKKILIDNFGFDKEKAEKAAFKSFGSVGRAIEFCRGVKKNEEELTDFLEEKIVSLWEKEKIKKSGLISWLLSNLVVLKNFNLNQNLQYKIIKYNIEKSD